MVDRELDSYVDIANNRKQTTYNSNSRYQLSRLSLPIPSHINQNNAFDLGYDEIQMWVVEHPDLMYVDEFTFPNGSKYRGQMTHRINGQPQERQGFGIQRWSDGAVYLGEWVDNKAEGKGVFWHAEGDVYVGEFKGDQANGFGIYTHINGSRYEGQWIDDVQEG